MIKHFEKTNCEKLAKKYGIKNVENFTLNSKNLVVGINGSGKTRLLKMIRDLCNENNYVSVYMDFSQLGNKFQEDGVLRESEKTAFNWAVMYKLTDEKCSGLNDLVKFTNNNIHHLIQFLNRNVNSYFANKRFTEINPLLYEFLGREVVYVDNRFCITTRDENSVIEIAKAITIMSPGERSLLYFVIQFVIMESLNVEYVILIDEPETHLHPIALTKLIKYILDNLNPTFSVICTHSVFLLPSFKFEEIKMMENGVVTNPSSKLYNNIYSSLIGIDDNESNSIYKFLSSIYEWNYSSFLSECFTEPKEIGKGKKDDKQFVKLQKLLSQYIKKGTINVLDYGAGSGRMAKCFELLENDEPESKLWDKLKYSLYDKYLASDSSFKERKWFDEEIKSTEVLYERKSKYDVIVLYNVLHEIPISDWIDTLKGIYQLLNDNGCLLFGERRVLSEGERPFGTSGYLVLDRNELINIFSTQNIEEIKIEEIENDPTICYVINKKDIHCPNTSQISTAIKNLMIRVFKEVIKNTYTGKKDRKYAFYCQEYFNAIIAIEELERIKEKQK